MTRKLQLVDAFWVTDFCGSMGYDNLQKHMKDGQDTCKEIEEFFKQRSKIEEEYSKSLQKLMKQTQGCSELSSLKTAWDTIKSYTDKIAYEHNQLAMQFSERAKQLGSFSDTQKIERKQEKSSFEKSNRKKLECHRKTHEMKKIYENKCRDMEAQLGLLRQARMAGTPTEKLEAKEHKSSQEMQRADKAYLDSIKVLEDSRVQWEKDMEQLCNKYEQLEIDRFNYLRNEMWVHMNLISATCLKDDEHCEAVRVKIELCDVDTDLTKFIDEKGTGKERPAMIPYRKYQVLTQIDDSNQHPPHPNRPIPSSPRNAGPRLPGRQYQQHH